MRWPLLTWPSAVPLPSGVLELHDVTFAYPAVRAAGPVLRRVSCTFGSGRVTAIIGPNGGGKSTLLRVALGVLPPNEGRVTLGGTPIAIVPARERARRVAFVQQQSSVAFAFAVREVVRLGLYAAERGGRAEAEHSVERALAEMDLTDRADDPIGLLSAGQQQRAGLARALAQLGPGPRDRAGQVLLADEPISAMDPAYALRALAVLRRVADEGAAVAIVMHDLALALRTADDAVLLTRDGRVAASGAARAVLTPATLEPVFGVAFEALTRPAPPSGGNPCTTGGGGGGGGGVAGGGVVALVPIGPATTL